MSCFRLLETGATGLEGTPRSSHLALAPSCQAAPAARRFVDEHTPELPAGERDALQLLTSELVTNAVTHGHTEIQLGVTVGSNGVIVAVHDRDALMPEQRPYTTD